MSKTNVAPRRARPARLDLDAPTAQPGQNQPEQILSRRALFAGAAGLAGFWSHLAAANTSPAAIRATAPPAPLDTGEKYGGEAPTIERTPTLRYLVDRITFGRTMQELATAHLLGYEGYLEQQLDYRSIDDSAVDAALAGPAFNTLWLTPFELLTYPVASQPASQLTAARILRATFSRRQLLEVMVEFWTDHFNIDILNGDDRFLKTVDDRSVIRPHALGKFPDLLRASAHSPAMLLYLDNYTSRVGAPNENYSRELMELHTMGVGGGYTQVDVEEAARALTGWTFYTRGAGAALGGTFRYRADFHDNGLKVIFAGTPYELRLEPGGGKSDGDRLLTALALHPSTAHYIALKLTRYLWGYEPPSWLVKRVADTYTRTGGDIPAMIRTIFLSDDVPMGPAKYKRPLHYMVSGMRAIGVSATAYTQMINNHLVAAGHVPFRWSPPDGYPDALEYWSGLVLPRWNFFASLAVNQISGLTYNFTALLGSATTRDQVIARLNAILGGTLTPAEQQVLRSFLPANPNTTQRRDVLGLALGAPSFQWY